MLAATLSKAGWGLMALVIVGGIEKLPRLATLEFGQVSEAASLQRPMAEQKTPISSKLPAPRATKAVITLPEQSRSVIGHRFAESTCDHGDSPADLVVSGDRITLRVFAEAANNTERFERRDLSGSFNVDASGNIALPGLGRLPVAGLELACLEAAIIAALNAEMNIAATVTVSFEARPAVVVQGTVIAPGSYEFSPNLSVSALLAKAGAGGGTADAALYRSLEARRHELRSLRAGLVLKHARLAAHRTEARDLQLPPDLMEALRAQLGADRVEGERAALQSALGELALRKVRDAAIRTDLESTLEMAQARRTLVRSRYEKLSRQRDALEEALQAECRGRCGASRRYDEMRLDNLNGRLSDLDLTVEDAGRRLIEARHALERHDREVAFIYAQADSKLALSMAETLAELNALDAQIASVSAQIMDLGGTTDRSIRVQRRREGQIQVLDAHRDFLLLPGDIVIVGPPDDTILVSAQGPDK